MVLAPTLLLNAGSGAAIVRPTFSRDFAGEKTLNNGTGPAIAFTRADATTCATFFDANGVLQTAAANVPRFDHDPATGASRGLLIEESRQNLLQRSEEFGNAYWTKTRASITANAIAAPDGTTTADLLVEDNTASNSHFAFRQIAHAGANGPVTATVFAKAKERTRVSIVVGAGTPSPVNFSFGETVFNLADGTAGSYIAFQAGTASNGTGSATIVNVGNGWYRCSVTVTPVGVTATDTQLYIALHNGTSTSYTGDNTSGAYIWGAQLEAGAFATSYIPTTSVAVTRQADSAIVNPISSFYNASEGTLFAEFSRYSIAGTGSIFVADNETIGNRVGLFGTVAQVAISDVYTTIDTFSVVAGTVYRGILGYKANDHAATLNGAAVDTNTAVGVPVAATHLRIGSEAFTAASTSGHIRRIAYWPKRLSNALLQSLTT
jgi:hypothetical protein